MFAIDHLVCASRDLGAGVDLLEDLLGVRAAPGGQHVAWGTRNALLALGDDSYLEIIGADPDQPPPDRPRPFGIDARRQPGLVTWAVKAENLEGVVEEGRRCGVDLGIVHSGSRNRADGTRLSWRLTDPTRSRADGIVPFFIDWERTEHPALTSPKGCSLVDLRAEHPDAARLQSILNALGLALAVSSGSESALIATIRSPRGVVELR